MEASSERSKRFIGGGWLPSGLNATWPLVELVVSSEGLQVGPNGALMRWVWSLVRAEKTLYQWGDVIRVERVQAFLPWRLGSGLRIETTRDLVAFWTAHPDEVLDAAEQFGPQRVIVRGKPKRIHGFSLKR